jgi:uncharacterized protein (DUF885 family)
MHLRVGPAAFRCPIPVLGLALAAAVALPLCIAQAPGSGLAAATPAADPAFPALADQYLSGYLAWRPGKAVALGFHEHDGRVTDFSRASIAAERIRLLQFGQKLERLNATALDPEAAWDLRVLQADIRREQFQFDAMRAYWANPMTYAGALDVNLYIKRDFAPLPDRVRSIVSILEQAPAIMTCARENLDAALPRPYIETAIEIAQGSAAFLETDLVAALREFQDSELRPRFEAANRTAVAELRGFVLYLRADKLPQATDRFAIGRDAYAQMLRTEMITQSPEEILELGLRELRSQQQAFADTARQIDPTRPPIEVYRAIQQDHPTEQTLLPDTARNLEAIRQFLVDRRIVSVPSEVRPRVQETPPFDRATSFASMDTPGPFETKATEAFYYVTPVEPDWPAAQKEQWLTAFNEYTTDVVSIHEVYPGHYVHALWVKTTPLSQPKKILSSYAFTEGWAHYAEQMMLEEGFGHSGTPSSTTPRADARAAKYRLAQQDEALLRLCRLCASVRLHCQGMTVDEATRFFQENCYYEEKPARQEALRGTYDPGYLFYALGKLMLLDLREQYRALKGPAFRLQAFHDEILAHGSPPIPLLSEHLLAHTKTNTLPRTGPDHTGTLPGPNR